MYFFVFLPGVDHHLHLLRVRRSARVLHHPAPTQDLLHPEVLERPEPSRGANGQDERLSKRRNVIRQQRQGDAEEPAGGASSSRCSSCSSWESTVWS